MDWYIDNTPAGPGNDGNTGHTPATAKLTIDGAVFAADFTIGNSPHNVYIKASGTVYSTNSNASIFWPLNVTNITVDRYPTDTGTSRPVISKAYVSSGSGGMFVLMGNNNFVVRNIHFIGRNPPGTTDSNQLGIIYNNNATTNVTVEYCIFEQNYSNFAIKSYNGGNITNLIVRYCHFFLTTAYQDDGASRGAVGRTVSYHIHGLNLSYCLFENYVYPIDVYRTSSPGEIVFIHHNSFVNCGRTGTGKIIQCGPLYTGDIFTIKDNIAVGNDSVGSQGVNRSGSVVYAADYNNWYGIETPYMGTPLPSAPHDIDVNPEFQGGSHEWVDARISLTNYLAPVDTNYSVVRGDSLASCQGAIFVAAYIPPNPEPATPTPVTISTPSIPGLGTLPCSNSELFKRLKSHLVDDNIYDTSDAAIGITNYMVTFTGNIGDMPVTSLTVYRVYRGETKILATVVPDATGSYSFSDRLPHGRASYYGKSSDGKYFSNTMHVHSYYVHVWLCAYATELLALKQETAQVRQNTKIEDGMDFDGDALMTDGYYLAKNFGQYITARKLEDMTRAEYQQLLLNVLEAYNLGPSVEALDLICEIFTDRLPSLLWYKNIHGFPTTSAKLRVLGPPSLNYQWDATAVYLYDHWYTVPAGSGTIAAGQVNYVYVDGTTSPIAVDNRLSVLASATMPYRYVMNRTSTISSGLVRVDADGSNVGVSGELYVTLDRFPVSFVGASGALAPFVSGIPGAFSVPHTSNVDLNIAQWDTQKSMLLGDITLNYTTDYENMILGVVHAGASAITGITCCERIDGMGIVSRDVSVHENCGELRINGSQLLEADAKLDLFNTLRDVKPAHKFFYVYMENTLTGAMEYYGKL